MLNLANFVFFSPPFRFGSSKMRPMAVPRSFGAAKRCTCCAKGGVRSGTRRLARGHQVVGGVVSAHRDVTDGAPQDAWIKAAYDELDDDDFERGFVLDMTNQEEPKVTVSDDVRAAVDLELKEMVGGVGVKFKWTEDDGAIALDLRPFLDDEARQNGATDDDIEKGARMLHEELWRSHGVLLRPSQSEPFGTYDCFVPCGPEGDLTKLADAFDRIERCVRARKMLHGNW